MKLILCIDEKNGILFNNRRQSRDKALCRYVLDTVGDNRLVASKYTAPLLDGAKNLVVGNISDAGQEDFFFAEEQINSLDGVTQLYLFNWNRRYPADVYFEIDPALQGFCVKSQLSFTGNSHPEITLTLYEKE